jgi:glycosyltransferase involved in cell wall biosynthesis
MLPILENVCMTTPEKHYRILFVLPSLAGGGAERVVTTLLRHIDRERFRVDLALATGGGPLLSQVPEDIDIIDIGASRTRNALPSLVRLIRKRRYGVVFSTLGHMNLLLRLAHPFLPRNSAFVGRETNIQSVNLGNTPHPALFKFLYKWLYPGFDRVICQSKDMLEDLVGHFSMPRERCILIPNPVDVERIREMAAAGEPDLPVGRTNLVACGKLKPQKGFDLLLKALASLDDTSIHLTIMGRGPRQPELEALARSLGIKERVAFAGYVDNPYPNLAACDAFVLSSRHEGFPNILLEALTLGARVAACDCPGDVRDILSGMPSTRLALPEDPQSLASAITKVLADERETATTRRLIQERYGAEAITRQYQDVFLEILGNVS